MGAALRGMGAQPLTDHAAHGEAAERGVLDRKRVEQTDDIPAQTFERVFARGHVGCAMAARVVAQHAKVVEQGWHLRVPHAVVDAERMR